ncbi:YgaP family membrane protein [Corynebacterium gerontici]|uniref:Inner membrane protein YgaP-like transmembrane domain-containing protein n=1 Tax=Corynebacterium gerontici TaxID=2079234 RepID=A0A3G6J1A8_9CORY|nr:DUF2892 domain-containing protein [Corynebacterium gerontici]AZA11752.1 hypothetical protein CGERO_07260 [Corynebacterium gerontici]
MKRNENSTDRVLRAGGAVVAGIAAATAFNNDSSTLGVVLGVVTVVLAATAVTGFCPAYTLFGVNTCKRK